MASNQTENYGLNQWVRSDKVVMEDFNADNAKIDAALAEHTGALAAHGTELSLRGNCQIEVRTFVGQSEQENVSRRLEFPVRPALAIVTDGGTITWITGMNKYPLFLGNLEPMFYRLDLASANLRWEGSTAVISGQQPRLRMDEKGVQYCMIVFYPKDMEITSIET